MEERLQKILSRAGFGSRRACEELIVTGRVEVNGKAVELGTKVDPAKDTIRVDGSVLDYHEPEKIYYMVNKPRFVLSDRDRTDPRRTVFSLVEDSEGLFVVGRLDFESEGLMLLTNDGALANKLSHPRYGKEKEYQVLVAKRPDEKQLKAWRHGVVLDDGTHTAPAQVNVSGVSGKGAWLRVVLTEGRKREIREVCKTIGLPVVRLVRVRIGTLELGDLKSGESRLLNETEIRALRTLTSGNPRAAKQAAAIARTAPKRAPKKYDKAEGKESADGKASYGEKKSGEKKSGGNSFGRKNRDGAPTFKRSYEQKPLHKVSRSDRKNSSLKRAPKKKVM